MTAKPHACVTIACDACGEQMQDDLILHFTSIDEARSASGHHEWFVAEDGRALCPCWQSKRTEHLRLGDAWLPTLSEREREELLELYPQLGPDYYASEAERSEALGLAESGSAR